MDTRPTHILKRCLFIASACLLFALTAVAQKPIINAVENNMGAASETVSIKGSNFGTDKTKIAVFFGAAKGLPITVTDQLIEVKVPAGATYNNVSVTYLPSGLTGYSTDQFLLNFNGDAPLDVTNLGAEIDFKAEDGIFDLCMCDFDGDSRVDIVTANSLANFISIFANTSAAAGTVTFNKTNVNLGAFTRHVKCGDINGDGKPDLVIAADLADEIYVLKNTSSGTGVFSFGAPLTLKFPGRKPEVAGIVDLDRDGMPEIVFSDSKSNKVSVLLNQSTPSTIQILPTPIDYTISDAVFTDGIFMQDLNGDNLPEIVTTQYQTNNSNLFILSNASTPGNINFNNTITKLTIDKAVKRIRIGDLDGDGKQDIAVTQLIGSRISIFLNKSTVSSLAFSAPIAVPTQDQPWGLDFGDLDGDGKLDIVVTSVTKNNLTILNNTTTSPGSVTFITLLKPTNEITKHVQIGDVDGDGKPDIAFTSIDNNNLSIFRNKTCIVPKVLPAGPLTICTTAAPLRLDANESRGMVYEWKNVTTNTIVKASSVDAFYNGVTVSGEYQVMGNADGGACSKLSNKVNITVLGAGITGVAAILPAGPICTGSTLQLKVNAGALTGVSDYRWSGPAGYAGTGATPTPVTNFASENTGRYYVEVIAGGVPGCVAQKTSITIGIIDINDFKVVVSGSDVLCQGDPAKALSVTPAPADFKYEWFEQTAGSVATGTTTYSTALAGEYYVKATSISGNCSNKQTDPLKITVVTLPVSLFTAPTEACKGQEIQFTNQSTTDPNAQAYYLWDFGGAQTSNELNPKHSFTTASATIKLTVSYKDGACSTSLTKSITLKNAPPVVITNPDNKYVVCVGEGLKLEVLGSFNSYKWSTGEVTPSILVNKEGIYKVEVTTSLCTLNAERIMKQVEPLLSVSADPPKINEGLSSQLTASGLENYVWTPAETLSAPTSSSPIAAPLKTTIYTVTGVDKNGCKPTATVQVEVIGEAIVNKLLPSNFFSPNNAGPVEGELWQVDKILDFPQCNVAIYDDKGIKVFEAKPYLNSWDGTMKGKRLPDGVYYYIIRCDGEESKPKSGSITLLR